MTSTQTPPPAVAAPERRRGLFVTGLLAATAAAGCATLVGAVAMAVGVDFELPDGGESIPVWAFAQLTFIFSMIGVALAAGLRRWSRHPSTLFVRVTVTLTAASLVPPFFTDANLATVASLVLIHVVAAAIFIPVLARRLTT